MKINKFSFGIGDRFGCQGNALLNAFLKAEKEGVSIAPVWNKSYREHKTVNSLPESVREEADKAVKELGWESQYLVDADHINLQTVDKFLSCSDFFTIDVAEFIGIQTSPEEKLEYITSNSGMIGEMKVEGIEEPFLITKITLNSFADQYLHAINKAAEINNYIQKIKNGQCIIEVSMDEVSKSQSPVDLLLILAALAERKVPVQTIAPKFTGRFNKGVDYVGDVNSFEQEFEKDVLVTRHAVKGFGLPDSLKLSVHSGSDKFSIYRPINRIIKKHDAGLHIKTAGTTWLEELAGLSLSGSDGLALAKEIYFSALDRYEELIAPYAAVISISRENLPPRPSVKQWDNQMFYNSIVHNKQNRHYNNEFRQMLHVAYKMAAEMGMDYLNLLKANESVIAPLVTDNIFKKHMKPIFID